MVEERLILKMEQIKENLVVSPAAISEHLPEEKHLAEEHSDWGPRAEPSSECSGRCGDPTNGTPPTAYTLRVMPYWYGKCMTWFRKDS
ncbi:hypothetical protein H920_02033 [Fukomys damarensis]|uniref:Uncharacterized protein n=1 Tax=Fukomys damarensis TaxID=885580 RepID=A0A091DWR9_FUKDA|nr:hypothetical protein H920_02033 [Fukomys damarensis]